MVSECGKSCHFFTTRLKVVFTKKWKIWDPVYVLQNTAALWISLRSDYTFVTMASIDKLVKEANLCHPPAISNSIPH